MCKGYALHVVEDCTRWDAPPTCSLGELATSPVDELVNSGWKLATEACNIVIGIDPASDKLQPGNELLWALHPGPLGEGAGQKSSDPRHSGHVQHLTTSPAALLRSRP